MGWDASLQDALYRFLAADHTRFEAALKLADSAAWIVCAAVLVALWFGGWREGRAENVLTRFSPEARERVLLLLLAMFAAFVIARVIASQWSRTRPLVEQNARPPVSAEEWDRVLADQADTGSFPSDRAAFWFALVAGLAMNRPRWAILLGWGIVLLSGLYVGVGYAYPTDIVGGAVLGAICVALVFAARRGLHWIAAPSARLFDAHPLVAYPLALLVLLDITQRFAWTLHAISVVFRLTV
jgi:membrane-associated phospholipid phosphatase